MNRREFLQIGATATLGLCASRRAFGQQRLSVTDVHGANVVCLNWGQGLLLVDSGPGIFDEHSDTFFPNVSVILNTHYHSDQTGRNALYARWGVRIVAHERTRQWMSTDYWVPEEDRYQKARPKAALPTEVFETTGSLKFGDEQ